MQRGLLLINLGTPKSTRISDIRAYLRAFLTDSRVIDLPTVIRHILVNFFILPFRAKRSARAYQAIWTKQGSPLLLHSENLRAHIQEQIDNEYHVALGMRYGEPSIQSALQQLKHCDSITILPLYPQYSSAANGSSIEEALRIINTWHIIPSLHIIRDFFQHPAYIKAQSELIKNHFSHEEHLLFSYHGIPERHITKATCTTVCSADCPAPKDKSKGCYRAQCYQSSRLLAQSLHLPEERFTTAFQSRLGKTPWIKPYTDETLSRLVHQGIRRLAIVCPSFVADCLETLEEIGIRAKIQWKNLGGEQLTMIPCLNTEPLWVNAIVQIIKENKI